MSEKNLTPRTLAIIITVAALTLAACNNSDSNTSKLANPASTAPPPAAPAPPTGGPPAPPRPRRAPTGRRPACGTRHSPWRHWHPA